METRWEGEAFDQGAAEHGGSATQPVLSNMLLANAEGTRFSEAETEAKTAALKAARTVASARQSEKRSTCLLR